MTESARQQLPRHISYWDAETLETQTSKRKYIEVREIRGTAENHDYGYRRDNLVDLTLYLDVESGTVVWDIEIYERNL